MSLADADAAPATPTIETGPDRRQRPMRRIVHAACGLTVADFPAEYWVKFGDVEVLCRVVDVAQVGNTMRLLVVPVAGRGQVWVSARRVSSR